MTGHQHIFLGHASEDKPRVRELYHQLKAQGFSPWLDAVDLVPGQNWRVEIPRAIKSAAIFLACLSKQSIAKRSYVQREFRYALSTYADLPPDAIYLIPVRLDDCDVPDLQLPELELNLRDLHWVDLFDDGGFEQLVTAIRLNVTPKTVPSQRKSFEIIKDIDATWCPEMVLIPEGSFLQGSPESEGGRFDREHQHEVTLGKPFLLGRYPVTFNEYDYFCEQTSRKLPEDQGWGRGDRPVINVSHDDALAYCAWLGEATDRPYHLPSEAQWEYACRAGTTTAYAFGDGITKKQANFGNTEGQISLVGFYPANAWGLHDMHGNVLEWCADWYDDYSYRALADPKGPATGTYRVVRGGSWNNHARLVRSAYRFWFAPGFRLRLLGFRCAGVQKEL